MHRQPERALAPLRRAGGRANGFQGGEPMAKIGICIAAHGVPAKDYPVDRRREFMQMSWDEHAGTPVSRERLRELEQEIRSWPRTPENDPYKAGADAVAREMRALGYELVEVGYNEFCDPTVEEAIDRLVDAGAERVIVVSTMVVPGGVHAEVEVARSVALAQERHPQLPITYAWPYDTARLAAFYSEQAERFLASIPQRCSGDAEGG